MSRFARRATACCVSWSSVPRSTPGPVAAVLEAVERALEAQLCRGVQARGAYARALEQPAAFGPGRLDHALGVALGCGDGIRRVAFSREHPVDRPCNGCIG